MTNNHENKLVKSCIVSAVNVLMSEVYTLCNCCDTEECERELSRFGCDMSMTGKDFREFFADILETYLSEIYNDPILGCDNPKDNPTQLEQAKWLRTLAYHNSESDFWDLLAEFYTEH